MNLFSTRIRSPTAGPRRPRSSEPANTGPPGRRFLSTTNRPTQLQRSISAAPTPRCSALPRGCRTERSAASSRRPPCHALSPYSSRFPRFHTSSRCAARSSRRRPPNSAPFARRRRSVPRLNPIFRWKKPPRFDAFPRDYAALLDVEVLCEGARENVENIGATQRLQFDYATTRKQRLFVKKVPIFGLC